MVGDYGRGSRLAISSGIVPDASPNRRRRHRPGHDICLPGSAGVAWPFGHTGGDCVDNGSGVHRRKADDYVAAGSCADPVWCRRHVYTGDFARDVAVAGSSGAQDFAVGNDCEPSDAEADLPAGVRWLGVALTIVGVLWPMAVSLRGTGKIRSVAHVETAGPVFAKGNLFLGVLESAWLILGARSFGASTRLSKLSFQRSPANAQSLALY